MNEVQPIRDSNIVRCIAEDLKAKKTRNYLIFMAGLYTGRRISDVLKLKVSDIIDTNGRCKETIYVRETKTKKRITLPIQKELRKELQEYCAGLAPHEYIFQTNRKAKKPMHRSTFYKILSNVSKKYGLEHIGCHTMRKTFGYHHYQEYHDIVILQEIFGHADISITKRYIGINLDEINKTMKNFKIF
jgi:integrase